MNPQYKFYLTADGTRQQVYPKWKDDVKFEISRESGQIFFRPSINGKFSLLGPDFDFVDTRQFETTFYVDIEFYTEDLVTPTYTYRGKFYKTDCEFNRDDKKVVVKITTEDEYTEILKNYESEYDIIPLAPEVAEVNMSIRPLLQFYVYANSVGSPKVTNYMAGMYWEEDAVEEDPTQEDIVNKYYFGKVYDQQGIDVSITPGNPPSEPINGQYEETSPGSGRYQDVNHRYEIWYTSRRFVANIYMYYWNCKRLSDGFMVINNQYVGWQEPWGKVTLNGTGMSGEVSFADSDFAIYARIMVGPNSGLDNTGGIIALYDRPIEDMTGSNWDYTRVAGLGGDGFIAVKLYTQTQSEPTEFGRSGLGGYFVRYQTPPSMGGGSWYPLDRSQWGYFSIWMVPLTNTEVLEIWGKAPKVIKDNYTIGSVIRVLLQKCAPSLMHYETEEYSQFLYGRNPLINQTFRLLMSPKSNYLKGQYDNAALSGKVTLQQILKMLKSVYNLYWFVDDGKLRIEHVSYFRNGRGYGGGLRTGVDLTKSADPRTGKPWTFGTNNWSFEKPEMPQRYEFAWMDEVTGPFTGGALEVQSTYVEAGRKEDISASPFTSDVDYMSVMASFISMDGFALLAPVYAYFSSTLTESQYFSKSGYPVSDIRFDYLTFEWGSSSGQVLVSGYGTASIPAVVFLNASGSVIGTALTGTSMGTSFGKEPVSPPEGTARIIVNKLKGEGGECIGTFSLPINSDSLTWDGRSVTLQNYLASFLYTVPTFFIYDMPSGTLLYNGQMIGSQSVQRLMKQPIVVPGDAHVDPELGIKTDLGVGEVNKYSLNLTSRMADVELLHPAR